MSINNTASFLIGGYFGIPSMPAEKDGFRLDFKEGDEEELYTRGLLGFAYCFLKKDNAFVEKYRNVFELSKRFYFENTARNAFFAEESSKICSELSTGMRIMPIKGAYLLLSECYPEPGARQMSDMDFSIDGYDFDALKSGMRRLGYVFVEDGIFGHSTFLKKETETPVFAEFHFQPLTFKFPIRSYPYKFDNDVLWSNVICINTEGNPDGFFRPNPEVAVLLTCFHSVKHPKKNFFWIADIIAEIKKHGIDWNRMEELVRRTGSSGLFYPLIKKFHRFTGIEIPAVERFRRGSDSLTRKYFSMRADREIGTEKTHFVTTLIGVENSKKTLLLLGLLFPAEQWLSKRYGKRVFLRLTWFCYLVTVSLKSFLGLLTLLFRFGRNIMKQ